MICRSSLNVLGREIMSSSHTYQFPNSSRLEKEFFFSVVPGRNQNITIQCLELDQNKYSNNPTNSTKVKRNEVNP
jgi:hypothetical protein